MFSSIRARMTAGFTLSVALLMLLACGGLIAYARHSAEQSARMVLSTAAAKLGHELHERDSDDPIEHTVDEEREDIEPADLALFLTSDDGHVRWSSLRTARRYAPTDGREWRTTSLRTDRYRLVIALPWTKTEASLRSLTVSLTVLSLFVVVLAAIGAWILVGRTLSPIGRLSQQANAETVENLRVHLKAPSRDAEIVGLVGTLNGLLSRLSETAAAKGRFYSAASHELRTPLQALSGHLELALAKDRSKEEYRGTLEEAYRQTRRLMCLTRNLLLLYQLDSSTSTLPDEPVDLAVVCRETLSQFRRPADERRLRIRTEIPDSAQFKAPATHAEVVVRNLIENAVRYANAGGQIDVALSVLRDHLELGIFNECVLPADWNSDKLFEAFARADTSRSEATGGTGLGLTICKSIAELNGWMLTIVREADGLRARLITPRCSGC